MSFEAIWLRQDEDGELLIIPQHCG